MSKRTLRSHRSALRYPTRSTANVDDIETVQPSATQDSFPIRSRRTDARLPRPVISTPKQNNLEAVPPPVIKARSSYQHVFTYGSPFKPANSPIRTTTRLAVPTTPNLFRLPTTDINNHISARLQTLSDGLDRLLFSWNFITPRSPSRFEPGSPRRFGAGNPSHFGAGNSSRFGAGNPSRFGSGDSSGFGSGNPSGFASVNPTGFASGNPINFASGNPINFASGNPINFASRNPINFDSRNPINFTSGNPINFPSENLTGFAAGNPRRGIALGKPSSLTSGNTCGYTKENSSGLSNEKLNVDFKVNSSVPTSDNGKDDDIVYLYTVDTSAAGRIVDEIDLDTNQLSVPNGPLSTLPPKKVPKEIQKPNTSKGRSGGKRKRKESTTDDRGKRKNLGQSQCAVCETPYDALLQKHEFLAISKCGHLFCSVCKDLIKFCSVCGTSIKGLRKIFV